jgi:hypothetical protein
VEDLGIFFSLVVTDARGMSLSGTIEIRVLNDPQIVVRSSDPKKHLEIVPAPVQMLGSFDALRALIDEKERDFFERRKAIDATLEQLKAGKDGTALGGDGVIAEGNLKKFPGKTKPRIHPKFN